MWINMFCIMDLLICHKYKHERVQNWPHGKVKMTDGQTIVVF